MHEAAGSRRKATSGSLPLQFSLIVYGKEITFSRLYKAELTLAFQVLYLIFPHLKYMEQNTAFQEGGLIVQIYSHSLLYGQLPSIFRNISVDQRLKIQIYTFC